MKKLLLLCTVLVTMSFAGRAQITCDTIVTDTLHYYFNKYYFKTGQTTYSNYPYYKSAAGTVTNVTHCGSRFENADPTLTITGVEAFAAKSNVAANLKIPIHMYLCNVGSNGMPVFPAIDSVITNVGGGAVYTPSVVGGNFTTMVNGSVTPNPHVVSGDYAVLIRNMSQVSGDTVYLLRTAGLTHTYNAMPIGWTSLHKYADDNYGYVRYLGQFYNTKNFTQSGGFGVGTDYEFMVAPRVQYHLSASHQIPQSISDFTSGATTDTICTRTKFTFTNTSSYQYTNRFYNLNEFYRKWNLYSAFVAAPLAGGGFSADSAITWNFEFKEQSDPSGDGRIYLPFVLKGENHGTISAITGMAGCFDNQFRARLRPMSAFGRHAQYSCNIPFQICMRFCTDDGTGLSDNGFLPNLKVYPNPLVNNRTTITGLEGKNTIFVYDVLGQLLFTSTTDGSRAVIDLDKYAKGTYVVRITNSEQQSRSLRIVNAE